MITAPSVTARAARMMRTRSSPRCSVSVITSSGVFTAGRSLRRPSAGLMSSGARRPPAGSPPLSVRLINSSSGAAGSRAGGAAGVVAVAGARGVRRLRPPPAWPTSRPVIVDVVSVTELRSRLAVSRISFAGSSSALRTSSWKELPIRFSSA